jgi:hypothetical protein
MGSRGPGPRAGGEGKDGAAYNNLLSLGPKAGLGGTHVSGQVGMYTSIGGDVYKHWGRCIQAFSGALSCCRLVCLFVCKQSLLYLVNTL